MDRHDFNKREEPKRNHKVIDASMYVTSEMIDAVSPLIKAAEAVISDQTNKMYHDAFFQEHVSFHQLIKKIPISDATERCITVFNVTLSEHKGHRRQQLAKNHMFKVMRAKAFHDKYRKQ